MTPPQKRRLIKSAPIETHPKKIDGKTLDRDAILTTIYGEVASGRALDSVLNDPFMPSRTTFWRWHMEDEEIRDNLARSRANGVDRHLGEIIAIADDKEGDPDPASRRVRIDARIKAAQMMGPRKYHPKLDIKHEGTVDSTVTVVEAAISNTAQWIADALGSREETAH